METDYLFKLDLFEKLLLKDNSARLSYTSEKVNESEEKSKKKNTFVLIPIGPARRDSNHQLKSFGAGQTLANYPTEGKIKIFF